MQHPVQNDDLTSLLRPEETILWSERRKQVFDDCIGIIMASSIVVLLIYAALCMAFIWKDLNTNELLFLPAIALCGLIVASGKALYNRQLIYVLTQQRAIIIWHIFNKLLYIKDFPCSRDMVQAITRNLRGSTDYIFTWQRMGRSLRIPTGFIGTLQAKELDEALKHCGVKLPAEEIIREEPPAPPSVIKLITPLLVIGFFICSIINEIEINAELYLTLYGEKATATVIEQNKITHTYYRPGYANQEEDLYHSQIIFTTKQGAPTTTLDMIGDKSPTYSYGEQIEILYDPQQPILAMRATPKRFGPIIVAILAISIPLALLIYRLRRLYLHRRKSRSRQLTPRKS